MGLEQWEWQLGAELDAWPVETSRRTPHCATLHVTSKKMRNQVRPRVAVNTKLGKGDKPFLAY
jgi:hypothetical protein